MLRPPSRSACPPFCARADARYGRRPLQVVQCTMMLLTFGAVTAYFVIIGQLLAQVLHHPLKCVALSTSCVWVTQCAIGVGVASVAPAACACTRSLAQACRLSGPFFCLPHAHARPRGAGEGTHGRATVRGCPGADHRRLLASVPRSCRLGQHLPRAKFPLGDRNQLVRAQHTRPLNRRPFEVSRARLCPAAPPSRSVQPMPCSRVVRP